MGNTPSLATDEQNEAAGAEAMEIFRMLDLNADQAISTDEWDQAFQHLDADSNGSISRKEWYLKQGTTEMYDAIFKKSSGNITREEWQGAFEMLDTNKDGLISISEWNSRRKVRIGYIPLGLTMHNWGVAVGDDFYEVLSTSWMQTEMAAAGPNGIVALGNFSKEEGARDRWLEAFKADTEPGKKFESCWLAERGEPRARPLEAWQDLEQCGWTMKSDADIEAWMQQWVEDHPEFKAIDPIGRECNDQTFALACIAWLTGTNFSRMTDNTKGRVVVYGGLAILAAAGGLYLANRMTRGSEPQSVEDAAPPQRERTQTWQVGRNTMTGSATITGSKDAVRPRAHSQSTKRGTSPAPFPGPVGGGIAAGLSVFEGIRQKTANIMD